MSKFKFKPPTEEQARALMSILQPKTENEVVIISAREIIYGLCMRIGKRTYERPADNEHLAFCKGGVPGFISRCRVLRIRNKNHKAKLEEMGLSTKGIIALSPEEWKGVGVSGEKFQAWLKFGDGWIEGMKQEAEDRRRTWEAMEKILREMKGEGED